MKELAPVSVVIPCFRCANTIERAVESVFKQTLKPYEIILVDDCSADGTLDFLFSLQSRYGEKWLRIIALDQNSGPGTARNVGWEKASQEFIAFLDSDDSWHPQKIEIQYRWMEQHHYVSLTGHESALGPIFTRFESSHLDFAPPRPMTKWGLLMRNTLPTRSIMLRRTVPERFRSEKYYSEDYLLLLTIICSGHSIFKFPLPLASHYKKPFQNGLSASMWRMVQGEIDSYRQLYLMEYISFSSCVILSGWSCLRFLRRLCLHRLCS